MASSYTIYSNVAAVELVTIPDGDSETPLVDSAQLSNGSGCGALRRVTLPVNFPAGVLCTFQAVEIPTDTDFANVKISDGTDKIVFSILSSGDPDPETISLPAIIFDSIRCIKMLTDSPMTEDVVVKFIFEPIYQGAA